MKQKEIEHLTFGRLEKILSSGRSVGNEYSFFSNELAMLKSDNIILAHALPKGVPFRMEDSRFGILRGGKLHDIVNLRDVTLTNDTIAFIGKGSIIEVVDVSPDFNISGFAFNDYYQHLAFGEQLPPPFNGQMKDALIQATTEEVEIFTSFLEVLWKLVHQPSPNTEVISGLIRSIGYFVADLAKKQEENHPSVKDNDQDIMNRFIHLVNLHCKEQHQLDFYAEKLYLNTRYMATIIKKASGVNAKEWIERALITEAKVMLKHTPMRVNQVAYELNFPNPSFFNKYFKRLTGLTPEEYRNH